MKDDYNDMQHVLIWLAADNSFMYLIILQNFENNTIMIQYHPSILCWFTSVLDLSLFLFLFFVAGKPTGTITTKGENINICWSPDGQTIAVGNKVGSGIHVVNRVWYSLQGLI